MCGMVYWVKNGLKSCQHIPQAAFFDLACATSFLSFTLGIILSNSPLIATTCCSYQGFFLPPGLLHFRIAFLIFFLVSMCPFEASERLVQLLAKEVKG